MTASTPVRILLVDDHTLFRDSLARLLAGEPDFAVVGACAASSEALAIVSHAPVDVLLLDFDLGQEKGTDLLRRLHAAGFTGRILVVTAGVTPHEASELLRGGVAGIFLKHDPPVSLCRSIREVAAGRVCFDQDLLTDAVRTLAGETGRSRSTQLTERERQVLSFVLDGLTNKEIADRLAASESAVKGTLQQLFAKASVRTRSQLVRFALEHYGGAL